MGKYLSVIIGAVVAIVGFIGMARFWQHFAVVLKGTLPVMLIFAGAIAVVAGLSELRDEAVSKKEAKK